MSLACGLRENKSLLKAVARENRGYRMIQSFSIENFRCFKQISLTDLRTINIVVGDNGAGKTALLEAIFLAAHAHPRVVTMMRQIRNLSLPQGQIRWDRFVFESLWEDLFHDFSHSKVISAEFTDSEHGRVVIMVAYVEPEKTPAFTLVDPIPELTFIRKRGDAPAATTKIRIDEQGNPVTEGLAEMAPPVYILPAASQFFPEGMVGLFSAMSRANTEGVIIEAMRQDFPQIEHIEILADATGLGLFIKTGIASRPKQPLGNVSSGAARYLNILLAIAGNPKGVVLVDEIENGIYWERMPKVWTRLRNHCLKGDVQLFASTHSDECLQSLIKAMEGAEEHFSLIRISPNEDGHTVEQFYDKTFLAGLLAHGEIR